MSTSVQSGTSVRPSPSPAVLILAIHNAPHDALLVVGGGALVPDVVEVLIVASQQLCPVRTSLFDRRS